MAQWEESYKAKKVSAEKAISAVQSGQRLVFAHAVGQPQRLVDELVAQKDRLENVEIVHMVNCYPSEYCDPGMEKHFRHNALFVGGMTRKAVAEGRADFTPCFFSEIPRLFRDNILPVDVAMIQVSPPDENGEMSYGVAVDYTLQAVKSAKVVIAEVNQQMPRTHGCTITVDEIDFLIETDEPLFELPLPRVTEVEEKIGSYVASLIPDGANLQLGIGAIPDAALKFLGDKKDLGIHTEMFSDGVVELVEKGVVNSSKNNLHPGKLVATFLMGSKRLYDFVDDNPAVLMKPVDYTNNVLVASKVDNLISINSAIQVDLHGQVNADTIGHTQFSAVGGQVDFVRSASLSKGGKSIIAFPSTTKKGSISRIVKGLDEGARVTTSRFDVQYIVTEYGIADLRGKTLRERKEALIEIAHPDFRDELRAD